MSQVAGSWAEESPATCTHRPPNSVHAVTQSSLASQRRTPQAEHTRAHFRAQVPGNPRAIPRHSGRRTSSTTSALACSSQQNTVVCVSSTIEIYLPDFWKSEIKSARLSAGCFLLTPLSVTCRWHVSSHGHPSM